MAADVIHQNAQANADLLQAALDSNTQGIRSAVALGADINHTDSQGRFALRIAAAKQDIRAVDCLLQLRADPNHRGADGHTALHAAAAQGHENVVKKLLTWGFTDTDGLSEAAVLAERQGNIKLCACLLKHLAGEWLDILTDWHAAPGSMQRPAIPSTLPVVSPASCKWASLSSQL